MLHLLASQIEAAIAVPEAAVPELVEAAQLELAVAVVIAADQVADA